MGGEREREGRKEGGDFLSVRRVDVPDPAKRIVCVRVRARARVSAGVCARACVRECARTRPRVNERNG